MTAIEHAIIATFALWVFYMLGKYSSERTKVERAISNTLDMLEHKGFIVFKTNPDSGEKELVKVLDIKG